jgi:hypothetical protein
MCCFHRGKGDFLGYWRLYIRRFRRNIRSPSSWLKWRFWEAEKLTRVRRREAEGVGVSLIGPLPQPYVTVCFSGTLTSTHKYTRSQNSIMTIVVVHVDGARPHLWTAATNGRFVHLPGDEYGEPWWNDTDRGKPKNSEKNLSQWNMDHSMEYGYIAVDVL